MVALVSTAIKYPINTDTFNEELLHKYNLSPVQRLFDSLDEKQFYSLGKLTEYFAWFIQFMSKHENREQLKTIAFDKRYDADNFVYYALKLNSDMLHSYIVSLINEMDYNKRQKLIDWFLL
jgi:hypothetical protein